MLIKFLFLMSYPKNHFLKSWSFSSMFSSLSYIFFSLMFKSLIYSELNFCIWYNMRVQLHFFFLHMDIQFFQNHLLKSLSFFHWMILAFLFKVHLAIYARIYFWALSSIPLVYVLVFILIPHCLDDCNFSKFWNQEEWDFQICSSFWRLFWLLESPEISY